MTGPKPELAADLIVVFDNNAYRDLVDGKGWAEVDDAVAELVEAERRNRVQALANPLVLLELVALLDNPARPSYKAAMLAVSALAGHCQIETGSEPVKEANLLEDFSEAELSGHRDAPSASWLPALASAPPRSTGCATTSQVRSPSGRWTV